MNPTARVKAILFDPVVAWAVIEKDVGDPAYVWIDSCEGKAD